MTTTSTLPIPRDGRIIALILASKGIQDVDERVIHQLLDFANRYTADVLVSAQQYADHASRPTSKIEKEDVELAIQMRKRYEFSEPPPRDYLATLAHELNSHPLPPLPESFEVVRLPPAHLRLTEVNFDIVPEKEIGPFSDREEDDESDSEDDEDADMDETREDADGDDEEMEEVGIQDPARGGAGGPLANEREIDEDYD
ncbi:transcription initiation factor TFIID subunit 9B, partial [Tremellales sp. Uapishka_1]